jgi:hypothetical protein
MAVRVGLTYMFRHISVITSSDSEAKRGATGGFHMDKLAYIINDDGGKELWCPFFLLKARHAQLLVSYRSFRDLSH